MKRFLKLMWCIFFHGQWHVYAAYPKPRPAAFGGTAALIESCKKCDVTRESAEEKPRMNCKHCGKEIKPCWLGHVSNFCFGWLHLSNYHDCEDGLHKADPASPVAQPDSHGINNQLLDTRVVDRLDEALAVAQSGAGGITDTYEEGDENPNNIRFTYPPSSPSGQAAAPTPEAHTPKNVYQLFKHKKDCTWITPLATGEGYWGCNCGLDSLLIDLEDFGLATSTGAPPSDEQFWQFMEENAEIVKRWPGWKRIAAGLGAASPTGGAEPPQMAQVSSGVFTSKFCTCPNQANEDGAQCPICGKLKPEPAAAEPSTQCSATTTHSVCLNPEVCRKHGCQNCANPLAAAEPSAEQWPSDLPANGMGAMNLITNFWTGDLKGLTKEGARIVDSLVAHVTKGLRAKHDYYLEYQKAVATINELIDESHAKDVEAAGLREQLEFAKRTVRLKMIAKLKTWIGRVGHEDYYKSQAKLLEFEGRAKAAEAQLATAREALRKITPIVGNYQIGPSARIDLIILVNNALAALAPAKEPK